ncbi:hypothetical protein RCL1_006761 [Eukaryota sp. TZLM3-RCL]
MVQQLPKTALHKYVQVENIVSDYSKFVANLINVDEHNIHTHAFSSFNLGGIGLTKASVLVKSAFLGRLRNFLFEFKLRFPNEDIENSSAPFLLEGKKPVDSLPEDTWARLFSFTSEVKEKKMSNLVFTFKKLQNKLIYLKFMKVIHSKKP